MTQLAIKWSFSFSPHPISVSALPGENRTDKICIKIYKKLYIYNFIRHSVTAKKKKQKQTTSIFPDMWPPTANQLQGLTVVQQHVY